MTESRDQRFFDGLNNAPREEDREAPSGAATGPQPIETSLGASTDAPSNPPEGFAAQEDPAGGKHHVDPPGDGAEVAAEPRSNWGQPQDRTGQSEPRAAGEAEQQPRPPRDALSEVDAAPRNSPQRPCPAACQGHRRRRGRGGRRANQATVAKRLRHCRPPVTNHPRAVSRALPAAGPHSVFGRQCQPPHLRRCPPRNALSSFPGMRCAMRWRPTRPRRHRRPGDKPPVAPSARTDLEARGPVPANDRVRSRQGGPPMARNDRSPQPTRNRAAAHAHRRGTGERRPVAEPVALNCAVSRFRPLN